MSEHNLEDHIRTSYERAVNRSRPLSSGHRNRVISLCYSGRETNVAILAVAPLL